MVYNFRKFRMAHRGFRRFWVLSRMQNRPSHRPKTFCSTWSLLWGLPTTGRQLKPSKTASGILSWHILTWLWPRSLPVFKNLADTVNNRYLMPGLSLLFSQTARAFSLIQFHYHFRMVGSSESDRRSRDSNLEPPQRSRPCWPLDHLHFQENLSIARLHVLVRLPPGSGASGDQGHPGNTASRTSKGY